MPDGESRPIFILSEDTERERGRDAQNSNIQAAKAIGDTVRSTLGPRGMDKMLVDSTGDVVITNDGVTILDEMDVDHPAAEMIIEVAETQEEEVGDGTTTAVVMAAELLEEAEELLDQGIHPTIITSGFSRAAVKSGEFLEDMASDIDIDDREMLARVATTAMTGKKVEANVEVLADLAVRAVRQVAEEGDGYSIDLDNVKVETRQGGSVDDSSLVNGLLLDEDRDHPNMPRRVEGAKIALINAAMEIKETETDSKISLKSPEELQKFMDYEEKGLRKMVDKLKEVGSNVVLSQKDVDDMAQHFLAKEGILAISDLSSSDVEKLARATDGSITTNFDDLTPEDLGNAGLVEERKISGEEMVFIEDCESPKAVSILVRGGTEHIVDEAERSLIDAMSVVGKSIESKRVVAGGGATEIELAMRIADFSDSISGKDALAVRAFADAIESIPRILAKNAGLDPVDTLVELRSEYEGKGGTMGIDAYTGEVTDMFEEGIIEPLPIKTQAVNSASEAAMMILRIDDVVSAKGEEGGEAPPAGGPGGAPGGAPGGMPGGMY